jgi:hypothetical protein
MMLHHPCCFQPSSCLCYSYNLALYCYEKSIAVEVVSTFGSKLQLTAASCCCLCCLQDKLVEQQLGPAPPARASPGMVMQYTTMMAERRASLLVDNISNLVEALAGVVVKVCALQFAADLASQQQLWLFATA